MVADAKDWHLQTLLQHRWDDAEGLQDFEGAGMHDGGPRGVGAFGEFVDRDCLDTAPAKFSRERQARRARTDDQDLHL